MTAVLLSLTLWLGVLNKAMSSRDLSDCTIVIRKNGFIQATSFSDQLWSVDTGGPLVWTEQLHETEPVHFFPKVTGDLFVRNSVDGGLSKFPKSIKDLAKLSIYDYDETHFLHGTVRKTRFLVDSISGIIIPLSQLETTDCSKVLFTRTDYLLELILKGTLEVVFRARMSEIGTENCLLLENVGLVEEEFGGTGEVVSIGYMNFPTSSEESGWSFFTLAKITVFMTLSLLFGFKLGGGFESQVLVSPCGSFISNSDSDKFTASTSASSPVFLDPLIQKPEQVGDRRRRELRIMKPIDSSDPMEPESPTLLQGQSGTSVKELISNGRYAETFESAYLMKIFHGVEVYRAKHRLDGKDYVLKVGKFRYDECLTISKVAMFKDVAMKLKLRYKHIVNYVTCWMENQDIQVFTQSEGVRSLKGQEESSSEGCNVSPADSSPIYLYLYIQCELIVKGENLNKRIRLREQISQKENCWIFKQILKGVAHVHSKNIVHRELK